MPSIRFELPDGTMAKMEAPDDWDKSRILQEVDAVIGSFNKTGSPSPPAPVEPPQRFTAQAKLARNKSPFQAAMIGAGREFDALGTGTRMLWNKLTGDTDEYNKLVQENNAKNQLMEPLREESPWATGIGSTLPYLAASPSIGAGLVKGGANIAGKMIPKGMQMMPALPSGVNTALRGGKVLDALSIQAQNRMYMNPVGKAISSVMTDPVKQGAALGGLVGTLHADDTALTGAATGAAGGLLAKTLFKPFTKRTNYLTDPQKEVVKEAKDMGYYLLPGTKTGDLILGQLDQRLAANPGVASIFKNRALQNNAVVSTQIARDLKLPDVPGWDATALARGYEHIGSVMDQVATRSKVRFDKDDVIKLYDIVNDYSRFPGTSDLANQWKDFLYRSFGIKSSVKAGKIKYPKKIKPNDIKWNFKGGEIGGDEYQKISTRLNQQIATHMSDPKGDRALGQTLIKLKDLLSEGLEKGTANKADVDLLNWARGAYRKLGIVRDSVDANSGIVDLKLLYKNYTKGKTPSKYDKLIKKDQLFSKLSRIGKLEQETKAKVDLATAGIAKRILGESPDKMAGFYKWSMAGIGDMDYHTLLPKTRVNLYMNKSGWPAATGVMPLINSSTYDRLQKIFSRATMGDSTPEELETMSIWE